MDRTNSTQSGNVRPDYIPAADYTSSQVAQLERERMWPKVWQIACREEEIPNVGDYVEYTLFDESVIIVRTPAKEIKAFYNTCQHRGRRLRDEPKGNITQFYCRYHGWKYDLNGAVTYVHNREDWAGCPNVSDRDLSLKSPKLDTWAGWVWINFDPNAESLRSFLGAAADFLDPFEFENTRIVWSATIHAPVNWKVSIEAFAEGYHSAATHFVGGVNYRPARFPGKVHGRHANFNTTFDQLPDIKNERGVWSKAKDTREFTAKSLIGLNQELKAMILGPGLKASERLLKEIPEGASDTEVSAAMWRFHQEAFVEAGVEWPKRLTADAVAAAGTDWHIFPNTICLPTPDGALWYRSRPAGADSSQCIFDIFCLGRVPKGESIQPVRKTFDGFASFVGNNPFLEEDFGNMLAVQKGMASRGWIGARTSPVQEIQISNFHRVLHEYLLKNT
jgi:phenylpropionate dioxygenase-like ring-hydroxylating dioxygenase large terminal subunit